MNNTNDDQTKSDAPPTETARGSGLGELPCSEFLVVEAGVRYWEDATVNGQEDTEGALIPLRAGDMWNPVIDMETGQIQRWPQGTTADIHYKVCDAGKYWIVDDEGRMTARWKGDYVPDDALCFGGKGYGDYIILTVNADGRIEGWNRPDLGADDRWVIIPNAQSHQSRPTKP